MDDQTWMDEGTVVAVSNGLKSERTSGLVWSVPKHRSLELEVQVSFRSFRLKFPRLVSFRHLVAATFASLEDPSWLIRCRRGRR
jgi:hypothetical protein